MSKKEKSDIRIVRLAITMFKCPLRYYFNTPRNWELAISYCSAATAVKNHFRQKPYIDYDDAISLFQALYDVGPSFFANVLE